MTADSRPTPKKTTLAAASISDLSSSLFDTMPMALWLEDYSALRQQFEEWRQQGVTNLRSFLEGDQQHIQRCAESIQVLRVNQATLDLYGAQNTDELQAHLADVLRDETYEAFISELEQLWSGDNEFQSRTVNYTLGGDRLDLSLKGVVLPGHEADWSRVLVVVDDITELASLYRRLIKEEAYARGVFEQSPVSLWVEDFSVIKQLLDEVRQQGITDLRTFTDVHPEFVERCLSEIKVLDVNAYTLQLFKAATKDELRKRLDEVFRDEMRSIFREQLIDLWEGRLFQQREVINHTLEGNPLNMHLQLSVFEGFEDDWSLVLLALTDITARKKAEAYLEYLGKHDVLTKLKNRSFFVDELARIERKGPVPITLITLDMNNLKQINDRLGHAAGDALLRRAGEVLAKAVDYPGASVSRIGGDEFMVLLPGQDAEIGAEVVANIKRLSDLNNQFYAGPSVHFSLGVATTWSRDQLEVAMREADQAMYEDKRQYYKKWGVKRRITDFVDDAQPSQDD